ncbi:MAG: hypothetical protein WKG07_00330 [Hymenobacter sp.]
MPRPRPVVFGLYAWSPEYGYRYLHPANRRSFELLEPVGKVFEKVSDLDDDSEWITLRYDEQQFLVRGELFKELYNKPPFGFGDLVEEVRPTPASPATAASSPTFIGAKPGPRHLPARGAQAQGGPHLRARRAAPGRVAHRAPPRGVRICKSR